jgi:hypothetical protein
MRMHILKHLIGKCTDEPNFFERIKKFGRIDRRMNRSSNILYTIIINVN